MTVDLNTCVPGQEVRLRHGKIVEYIKPIKDRHDTSYEHLIDFCCYMNDGCYWEDRRTSNMDVIEILPLETTESTKNDKHPSVAWWESCPWITDRPPTKQDGSNIDEYVLAKTSIRELPFLVNWASVPVTAAWVHLWNWQPVTLTNKKQALELLNKHEGGWCPTPKEWTIIRKGLEE